MIAFSRPPCRWGTVKEDAGRTFADLLSSRCCPARVSSGSVPSGREAELPSALWILLIQPLKSARTIGGAVQLAGFKRNLLLDVRNGDV